MFFGNWGNAILSAVYLGEGSIVRKTLYVILAAAVCAAPALARTDTLIIDGLEQARATNMERPSRGMSMDKVETTWGAPTSKQNAVGEPPITRWEYAEFVVYFEYRHVIHAVRRH